MTNASACMESDGLVLCVSLTAFLMHYALVHFDDAGCAWGVGVEMRWGVS